VDIIYRPGLHCLFSLSIPVLAQTEVSLQALITQRSGVRIIRPLQIFDLSLLEKMSAASSSSAISNASTSGSEKLALSSSDSSLSQKIDLVALEQLLVRKALGVQSSLRDAARGGLELLEI
jgi:hypothetical protein